MVDVYTGDGTGGATLDVPIGTGGTGDSKLDAPIGTEGMADGGTPPGADAGGEAGGSGGSDDAINSGGIIEVGRGDGGDAAGVGMDVGGTAETGDSSRDTCAASGTGAVAILGCPCSSSGVLACNGNSQPVTLICNQGTWTLNQTCQAGNLCDSRVGLTRGTCQPIDPLCQNATPGQNVCATATSVAQCGPDLVSETAPRSCTGSTPVCLSSACVACKPSSTEACGVCNDGTATCDRDGTWGACTGGSSTHTYYRDADADGYGDAKTSTTVCGAAPAGYVSSSSDCCDSDANAHPGQTGFYSSPDACGSYDYNCDGVDTLMVTNLNTSCTVVTSTACGCDVCVCDAKNVCSTQCTQSGSANPPCGAHYNTNGIDLLSGGPGMCIVNPGGGPGIPQSCH